MSLLKKLIMICLMAGLAINLVACGEEGTAEKAGKEIDKAFDAAKEKVHEATE